MNTPYLPPTQSRRVCVVGAGIGGLVTAVALQRRGVDAHVYEAAAAGRDVGKGIWVPPNAMRALDRLGLAAAVAEHGVALERAAVQTAEGRAVQEIDFGEVRARHGHTTVSVLRADLHRVLADALRSGTLHWGHRCTGVEADGPRPAARFGDRRVEADLVVGADGVRSVVREAVAPEAPFRFAGQTCTLGVARLRLAGPLARSARELWGGPSRFGFSPVGPETAYWFAPVSGPPVGAAAEVDARHLDGLRRRYAAFAAPVPAILAASDPSDAVRVDLGELAPLPRWHRGRVVLVGDAAHAMTPNLGQGGAQAVEDGVALARALSDDPDWPAALARYERARRATATRVARTSWWMGKAAHLRPRWARGLRDAVFRATPDRVSRRQLDDLYGVAGPRDGR